ncbi:Flagellar sensor histidine kinase FleS [Acidisarcina polymorpha]|uniref:histidine kinase n=1 Tax=Acidisarcina polymorpha TaxID=2211140 RepID=A0A2Z5FXI3_9BACT|nr:ATP-binding protein [Acidisarcina polymorpha]AXC11096.1 Flagellar sensor histidine kinase FleS [Acidisarcina polymorpha]
MRLKTKLVLAITGLVFVMVTVLSILYLSQLLHQQVEQSFSSNDILAHQIVFATRHALEIGFKNHPVDSKHPEELRKSVAVSLREDQGLSAMLNSVIRYSPTVFDISIADWNGLILVSTDVGQNDQPVPPRPDFSEMRNGTLVHLIQAVFGKPRVYDVSLGAERNGEREQNGKPFLTVRIGIRSSFLSNSFQPWLIGAFTFSGVAILGALLVSAFVANLALQPLTQISERLDAFAQAEMTGELESGYSSDAVVQVSYKIERLGRRMRNVEEVFSALKENLDQIMTNLEDGILLFTRDARAVLVSDSVERFLGMGRNQILGVEIHEIFDRTTVLGSTVRDAFDAGVSIVQEEITTETGRRVQISLDFIHDDHQADRRQTLGALLTLHDLESVREIESELELSRRMAAIGRLTSGVGHEVKNPINAIVVHLELLRNKLDGSDDRALRHLEIIQSEIQRLDRVVQTLVDFSRPVELQLQEQDLREVVSSVLLLASAEFETRDVQVTSLLPDSPVLAKIDSDLMKQALLNVVLNGAQAMADGGKLEVKLNADGRIATISIRDHGEGIPEEIRQKIFDLYFTTKRDGSGIGLAMTYRILQLHNGQVDVQSQPGKGTTFVLALPLSNVTDVRLRNFLPTGTALSKEPRG